MLIKNYSMTLVTDINLWNWSFVSSKTKKWSDDIRCGVARVYHGSPFYDVTWLVILIFTAFKNLRYYSFFICGWPRFKMPDRQGNMIEDLRGFPQFLQTSVGILPQSVPWFLSSHVLSQSFFTNRNTIRLALHWITDRDFR